LWIACKVTLLKASYRSAYTPGTKVATVQVGGSTLVKMAAGEDIPDGALVRLGSDGLVYASLPWRLPFLGYAVGDSRIVE